jgi:hypothetical protein
LPSPVDLFRQASKLLGEDAGIESDPYETPSRIGEQPKDDKVDYFEWAESVLSWYRFTGDGRHARTIWRLHARGASVREIGDALGMAFSSVAETIRISKVNIKLAERRRQRGLAVTIAQCSPRVLLQLLLAKNE